jgi:hypothetical protein
MILGEMCLLLLFLLIYVYVAVCRFCAVRYLAVSFSLLFTYYSTNDFIILCMFVLFLSILCFHNVLCIVYPLVYGCLFPIFVHVYQPLPLGGNPSSSS